MLAFTVSYGLLICEEPPVANLIVTYSQICLTKMYIMKSNPRKGQRYTLLLDGGLLKGWVGSTLPCPGCHD